MWGKKVKGIQAKQLVNKGALLIDIRNPVAFRDGTITGATNIPISNISQLLSKDKTTKVIFFGENKEDPNLMLMLKYAAQVFTDVYYMDSKDDWN